MCACGEGGGDGGGRGSEDRRNVRCVRACVRAEHVGCRWGGQQRQTRWEDITVHGDYTIKPKAETETDKLGVTVCVGARARACACV